MKISNQAGGLLYLKKKIYVEILHFLYSFQTAHE